jgi:hypothetical protein
VLPPQESFLQHSPEITRFPSSPKPKKPGSIGLFDNKLTQNPRPTPHEKSEAQSVRIRAIGRHARSSGRHTRFRKRCRQAVWLMGLGAAY